MSRLRRISLLKKAALGMMVALEATYLFGLGVAAATEAGLNLQWGQLEASHAILFAGDAVRLALPLAALFGLAAIWLLWRDSIWVLPVWAIVFILNTTIWLGLGPNPYYSGDGGILTAIVEIIVAAMLIRLFARPPDGLREPPNP